MFEWKLQCTNQNQKQPISFKASPTYDKCRCTKAYRKNWGIQWVFKSCECGCTETATSADRKLIVIKYGFRL